MHVKKEVLCCQFLIFNNYNFVCFRAFLLYTSIESTCICKSLHFFLLRSESNLHFPHPAFGRSGCRLSNSTHSSQLRLIHQTSSVLRQLPLELLSEIFDEGGIKIISLSNIRPIIIYLHSSQCRLIPYLHQRPIFFKANSIHSSIVAILELIRGAQCLIEVIRSSGEVM